MIPKWTYRWTAITATAGLCLFLGACGGGTSAVKKADDNSKSSVVTAPPVTAGETPTTTATPTTQARQPIQIVESGFTQHPADSIGNSYVSYAVVVRNPNSSLVASSVSLNVAFYDAAGKLVTTESPSIDVVLPKHRGATADSTQISGVASMKVQALVDSWEAAPATVGSFTPSGVNVTAEQYGGIDVTGTVRSTFAKDLKDPQAVALYRDAAGKLIGGARTYIDFVPANGEIAFKISDSFFDAAPPSTEVLIALSNLSLY